MDYKKLYLQKKKEYIEKKNIITGSVKKPRTIRLEQVIFLIKHQKNKKIKQMDKDYMRFLKIKQFK